MSDDYLWDPSATPDLEIVHLESLLREAAYRPVPLREAKGSWPRWRLDGRRWAAVAAVVLLAIGAALALRRDVMTPWAVVASEGTPVVRDARGRASEAILTTGGVIETDARSAAVLNVGRIGRARLGPGSRLRLLRVGASEHRLALEQGTMHATIDAPPRYFLVETASALAVDLGCVYTLSVDERGAGRLTVERGEVELERDEVRSSVLAGNVASLRPGKGPGLPYPIGASDELRRAVALYDAEPAREGAVDAVLAAADGRSTITLWHLLQRVDAGEREKVYARLAEISPPPATVTRDRVLRGESGALQRWRTALQPAWAVEPGAWWRVW